MAADVGVKADQQIQQTGCTKECIQTCKCSDASLFHLYVVFHAVEEIKKNNLLTLFWAYRPCIQGSISQAGRWGSHMAEGHNLRPDSGRCHHCHKCTVRILMAGKKKHAYKRRVSAWIMFPAAPLNRGRHLPSLPCWTLRLHTNIPNCNSLVLEGNEVEAFPRTLKHTS